MDAAPLKKQSSATKKKKKREKTILETILVESREIRGWGERPLLVLSSCEIPDSSKHSMEREQCREKCGDAERGVLQQIPELGNAGTRGMCAQERRQK